MSTDFTLEVFIIERCDIIIFALLLSILSQPSLKTIKVNKSITIAVTRIEKRILLIVVALKAYSASMLFASNLN